MIKHVFSFCMMMIMTQAQAALTFEELAKAIGSPAVLKGNFKQEKFIQTFDTSIHSAGHFEYYRGRHIQWNTVTPVENELIMTPTTIISREGGRELINLDSDSNPSVKIFSQVFFAVFTADWGLLREHFDIEVLGSTSAWTLALTPKANTIKGVIQKVHLQGGASLQDIILDEPAGDKTKIHFTNVTTVQ